MEFWKHWRFCTYQSIFDLRKGPANVLIPLSLDVNNANINSKRKLSVVVIENYCFGEGRNLIDIIWIYSKVLQVKLNYMFDMYIGPTHTPTHIKIFFSFSTLWEVMVFWKVSYRRNDRSLIFHMFKFLMQFYWRSVSVDTLTHFCQYLGVLPNV